jgi:ATP-dependent Lon protease
MAADKEIFLVAQLDPAEDDPDRDALYDIGVIATVLQLLKLPDGTVRVLVEGQQRASLVDRDRARRHLGRRDRAGRGSRRSRGRRGRGADALGRRAVRELFAKLNKKLPAETAVQLGEIEEPSALADSVAANIAIKVADKQALLGRAQPGAAAGDGVRLHGGRARRAAGREEDPQPRQAPDGEDPARILSERADEGDPARARQRGRGRRDELAELARKIAKTKLSKEARTKASRAQEAAAMAPMSAEATVAATISTWLLGLPWGKKSKVKKDIAEARRSSTRTITGWRRSRTGSSNISPSRRAPTS